MAKEFYTPFSKFVLRSPLFPFERFLNLFSNKETNIEGLKKQIIEPVFQEALYLASPELFNETEKWVQGKITDKKECNKLLFSIVKYFARMTSRCTPFGLFAGFCVGEVCKNATSVILNNTSEFSRHTRFDMNYLCALAQDLQKNPEIKYNILYFLNSSIYKSGQKLRYVEYRYTNAQRKHFLVGVDYTEYLQRIIDIVKNGACLNDIINAIISDDVSKEEAEEYVNELIESQVLVSELEPHVTGRDMLSKIIEICKHSNKGNQTTENELQNKIFTLESVNESLKNIDANTIGTTLKYYKEIAENLNVIQTKYDLKYLYQTDMKLTTEKCQISKSITDDIYSGLSILNRISIKSTNSNLKQFCESFYERYEDSEIPLLQALDTESGVGYKQGNVATGDISPLINDIAISPKYSDSSTLNWNKSYSFLFKKYIVAIKENNLEIEITDNDITKYFKEEPSWEELPDTIPVMAQVIESSNENENNKNLIHIISCGGSSAANLIGRFCHADENLLSLAKEITDKEKALNPDYIIAEIVHLPEARTGNVILRPVLRDYEIPYLAQPSVHKEQVILLDDLMLSVKGGKVLLRSIKYNKIIIPRLSNAHNFSYNSLPIYNFLGDLQTQGKRIGLWFDWGLLENECSFLPRIKYKNIIFYPATWNIQKDEIKKCIDAKNDDLMYSEFQAVRNKLKLPLHVVLDDGDNELLLNLDNLFCIKTLFSLVKNRSAFKLQEFLFNADKNLVKNDEGNFLNQIIVCFYKNK